MDHRKPSASLVARSAAIGGRPGRPPIQPPRLLPSRQRGGGMMRASRFAPLTLLAALALTAVAAALFAIYVYQAYAQEGQLRELVADTGTAATTYTDATVAAGTTYIYRIKAINEHGTSERSRWFHIDIPGLRSG